MPRYDVTVMVEYVYEVEADDRDEAESYGWDYEEYPFAATVSDITVSELEEETEEEQN